MSEITLPQEVVDQVIQAMVDDMLKDGLSWNLRTAIEDVLKRRVLESGVLDSLAEAIIAYIVADQDAITRHIGGEFIEAVGDSLATVYKAAAQAIAKKMKW